MGRRTLLLIASILVAAVGTALIFLYVRGAEQRAQTNAELVRVVVASDPIPAGQTVGQSKAAFGFANVPSQNLPVGNYKGDAGLVELNARSKDAAIAPIPKNAIIVRSAFGTAGAATSSGVAPGKVAISMQLSDPNRVAGLLTPGTQVAVIVTTDPSTKKDLGLLLKDLNPDLKVAETTALMNDAKVISIGSTGQTGTASKTGETVDSKNIAVEVSTNEALLIRAGERIGELSLAILGNGAQFKVNIPPQILIQGAGNS